MRRAESAGLAVGQRGQVAVGDREPFSRNGEGVAHVSGDRVATRRSKAARSSPANSTAKDPSAGVGAPGPVVTVGSEVRVDRTVGGLDRCLADGLEHQGGSQDAHGVDRRERHRRRSEPCSRRSSPRRSATLSETPRVRATSAFTVPSRVPGRTDSGSRRRSAGSRPMADIASTGQRRAAEVDPGLEPVRGVGGRPRDRPTRR